MSVTGRVTITGTTTAPVYVQSRECNTAVDIVCTRDTRKEVVSSLMSTIITARCPSLYSVDKWIKEALVALTLLSIEESDDEYEERWGNEKYFVHVDIKNTSSNVVEIRI